MAGAFVLNHKIILRVLSLLHRLVLLFLQKSMKVRSARDIPDVEYLDGSGRKLGKRIAGGSQLVVGCSDGTYVYRRPRRARFRVLA